MLKDIGKIFLANRKVLLVRPLRLAYMSHYTSITLYISNGLILPVYPFAKHHWPANRANLIYCA